MGLAFADGRLRELWRAPIELPANRRNWENPRGLFNLMSLAVADLDGDGRAEIIGGDNTIYRVDLDADRPRQVTGLKRQGRAAMVAANLERLGRAVEEAEAEQPGGAPFDIEMSLADPGALAFWRRLLPYPALRFVGGRKVIETTPPLNSAGQPFNPSRWQTDALPGTQTLDQIEAIARQIEATGQPMGLSVGHSCMPFITLSTAERVLAAAPTHVASFVTAEDEQPSLVGRYLDEFIGPLADLCAARGGRTRVILKNKGLWWLTQPASAQVYRSRFAPGRGAVLVAATEDSNSRTPELNLFARVGLRQAGLMQFRVSVHQDLFSYSRFQQYEHPKTGSPFLRRLVAQTVLGGTDFRAHGMFTYKDGDQTDLTVMGRESLAIFGHLLGKGLVRPPRPEDLATLSPLGVVMHEPPEAWLEDAHNGHAPQRWRDDPLLDQAVLPHNGCTWGLSPTPSHALQAVLFRKRRQFGTYVPATPYGAVAMVPAHADLSRVVGVSEWWHTDGVNLWRDGGPRLTGVAAAEALRVSFEKAAGSLPFRALGDDAFCQAHRPGDGRWRVCLIDPGWVDPRERRVRLLVQVGGTVRLTDRLSGETLAVADGEARVTVPVGGLRILDAEQR